MNNANTSLDAALEGLADVTLGSSPSIWPLAWGWWVLIILTIVLIAALVIFVVKYRNKRRIKSRALAAIVQINESEPQALRKLHSILRAAVMHYYPAKNVCKLHGSAWQEFLVSKAKGQKRITQQITAELMALESSLYTKNSSISIADAKQSVTVWVQCCLPPSKVSGNAATAADNDTSIYKNDSKSQGVQHV
ncbi:MAG: hypothetical protein ACI97K_001923 [Glaciecola sp.]